jgi:hypothetical protein
MANEALRREFTRYIKRHDRNAVLARSRGLCAFPGCTQHLFGRIGDRVVFLGEHAHRFSHSDQGPCPLPSAMKGKVDKNSAENLGIFCATHHAVVDRRLEVGDWDSQDFDDCLDMHIRYQEELQRTPFKKPAARRGLYTWKDSPSSSGRT